MFVCTHTHTFSVTIMGQYGSIHGNRLLWQVVGAGACENSLCLLLSVVAKLHSSKRNDVLNTHTELWELKGA